MILKILTTDKRQPRMIESKGIISPESSIKENIVMLGIRCKVVNRLRGTILTSSMGNSLMRSSKVRDKGKAGRPCTRYRQAARVCWASSSS